MTRQRQIEKNKETRQMILDAAQEIVSKEGIKGLSIRKITKKLEYSPASVYHYFKNKDEIVEVLIKEGYSKIIESISDIDKDDIKPELEIKHAFENYIHAALEFPEEYFAILTNDSSEILKSTAVLEHGVSNKRKTFKFLTENIKRGVEQGRYKKTEPELTAQILWTATFGLVLKLIIEKNISRQQKDRLIEHHFRILFNGIIDEEESKCQN